MQVLGDIQSLNGHATSLMQVMDDICHQKILL
jgi:hypothetical protein